MTDNTPSETPVDAAHPDGIRVHARAWEWPTHRAKARRAREVAHYYRRMRKVARRRRQRK